MQHDLSWAKTSPLPLSVLIRKNAEMLSENLSDHTKIAVKVELPSESDPEPKTTIRSKPVVPVMDEKKVTNLVLFKQFCLEVSR